MHLRGQPLRSSTTQTVVLPRPDGSDWTFTIQPLPLGFHQRLRERGIAPPSPPVKVARDSTGRPLRDDSGLAITTADTSDPQFLTDLERYHQRVAVLAITESLRADPHVRFDTPPPKPGVGLAGPTDLAWPAYADALHAELESAGFAPGDLILLCQHICRLSNLLGDQLQRARANFSPPQIATTP